MQKWSFHKFFYEIFYFYSYRFVQLSSCNARKIAYTTMYVSRMFYLIFYRFLSNEFYIKWKVNGLECAKNFYTKMENIHVFSIRLNKLRDSISV